MSNNYDSLGDRMKAYEAVYDLSLMKRVPIMVRVDGRSFSRFCRKLKKPYEPLFSEAMVKTMFAIATDVSGAVFAYTQSDEITLILRNDQSLDSEPWFANRLQKMVSQGAAMATDSLKDYLAEFEPKLELIGKGLFDCKVNTLPNLTEAANNLIWRQQDCMRNSVSKAAEFVLGAKLGRKSAIKFLENKSSLEKVELMKEECGIDYYQEYPISYQRGISCYKTPYIIPSKDGEVLRKKWFINLETPNFVQQKDFVHNILVTGHDIFRWDNVE